MSDICIYDYDDECFHDCVGCPRAKPDENFYHKYETILKYNYEYKSTEEVYDRNSDKKICTFK